MNWMTKTMAKIMKKTTKALAFVALFAATLVSCNKENETVVPKDNPEQVSFSFASEKPELINADTRTVYTNGDVEWSAGDKIRVGIKVGDTWMAAAGEPEQGKFPKLYVSDPLVQGGSTAQFTVPNNFTVTTEGIYKFYGIYPSSIVNNTDAKTLPSVSINIPGAQEPVSGSFDNSADVMFAQSANYSGIPSDRVISLDWTRVVAHADITLKKLPTFAEGETLSSIKVSAQEGADLVGSHLLNLEDGTVTLNNGATAINSVTITPTNVSIDNVNHTLEFWFTSLPFTATSLEVVLTTNKKTYTKEYTGISKTFMANRRNTLGIGMSGAIEEDVVQPGQVIPNGDYVIAYTGGNFSSMMLSDDYVGSTGANKYARACGNLPGVSADGKVHANANAVWSIQYSNGKYSIQSVETGTYLSGNSGSTDLEMAVTATLFDGSKTGDTYQLTVTSGSNTRGIGINTSTTPMRFGMYKGDNTQFIDLTLIPAISALVCAKPIISFEGSTVTITCATADANIYYTTDGSTPTTSSTLYEGAFNISETATVKAIAVLNGYENSSVAEKECVIIPVLSIAQVIAAESGASVLTSGVVAQINLKGFVITDGNNNIGVYYQSGTPASVEIGQSVVVSGTRDVYNHVAQINNPSVTAGATGQTVIRTNLVTITSQNATGYTAATYVSLAGTLTRSTSGNNTYYNISISGSDVKGSLYQVSSDATFTGGSLASLLGKQVTVTGYVVGSSNSYLYIAPVDIIKDPNVPDLSISPATTSSNPASWPADNDDAKTFTVSATNGTWAITDASTVSGWANISTSGDVITVTPNVKQATEAHTGSIVITLTPSHEGYEAQTATIYLSQAKYSSGGEKINQVLFHETFGNNAGSARNWSDSYSVKSGVADVYSGITSYTVSNAKQSKNTMGSTQSGLSQTSQGTDAYVIIGPLSVANAENMVLTYQWKAASIKGTYSTALYYATSANGSYTAVSGTGDGATTFVERRYVLPAPAQVNTLYLKIVWNTSNTSAIIDEVNLQGDY